MKSILLGLLLTAALAYAIPQEINFQGQLNSAAGTPLDTVVFVTFPIHHVNSGGTSLWSEVFPFVVVTDGLFNVRLGHAAGLPDLFSGDRWIGITVGSDTEMAPRQKFTAVSHAYRVGTVDGASGGTISGKLNVGEFNTNSGIAANVHGRYNQAPGDFSVVAGGGGGLLGDGNTASGTYSAVVGGSGNDATGGYSVVNGGYDNSASSQFSSISGGNANVAADTHAAVVNGFHNFARGDYSFIANGGGPARGDSNSASGKHAFIGNGAKNRASGAFSFIGNGGNEGLSGDGGNTTTGEYSTVLNGQACNATALMSFVGTGIYNDARAAYASVVSGYDNQNDGTSNT